MSAIVNSLDGKQGSKKSSELQQVLVVVCLCSLIIFILMSICLMSSYWITADGFRQGLLYLCIDETSFQNESDTLPFDLSKQDLEPGCYPNRDVGYLKLCTILCLLTQLSAIASACLIGLSIRMRGSRRVTCLRFAICTTLSMFVCDICLLVIYPTQFAKELDKSNRDLWELNAAFGLACGSAILALGSIISLVTAFIRHLTTYQAPTRV